MDTKLCTNPTHMVHLPLDVFSFQKKNPTLKYAWCDECRSNPQAIEAWQEKQTVEENTKSLVAISAKAEEVVDNLRALADEIENGDLPFCSGGNRTHMLTVSNISIGSDGKRSDYCKSCLRFFSSSAAKKAKMSQPAFRLNRCTEHSS